MAQVRYMNLLLYPLRFLLLCIASFTLTTVAWGQSFLFDFDINDQPGISETADGLASSWDWDGGDSLDGTGKTGTLFFELFPGEPLVRLDLEVSTELNWTVTNGLSDGSGTFDDDGEFVSFTFGHAVRIDELDLASLGTGDRITLLRNSTELASYTGADVSKSRFDPGLAFAANETFTLRRDVGAVGFDAMTVSAVPEPGTLLIGMLGSGLAIFGSRRRKRSRV